MAPRDLMGALAPLRERSPKWLGLMARLGDPLAIGEGTLIALAGIVGIYVGLATGLLANFTALFQFAFFPGLGAEARAPWPERVAAALERAPWHLEFLAFGAIALVLAATAPALAKRQPLGRIVDAKALRAIAFLMGFGLLLYYPLLGLATLNASLRAGHGDFLTMLERAPGALVLVAPAAGGLLVGLLLRHLSPESRGHGVVEVLEAIVGRDRRIPGSVALWKSVAAGLTIGSGGSAGREGPVVQIGGAVGNEVGLRLGLAREDLRLLIACGGGAGIAASFNTPIAGAVFALEILLGDFAVRSFSPILVAAVTATLTSRELVGAGGEIAKLHFALKSPLEVATYAVLGVLAALVATAYVRSLHASERFFSGRGTGAWSRWMGRLPLEARLAAAGLGVGAAGWLAPSVMGNGYETMNAALAGQLGATAMLAILALKLVATNLTLGSGAPGGSFFPALFLGAMLGGVFGLGVRELLPAASSGAGAYAAVGMAAAVGATVQGPLTAVLMLFELTGSYEMVLPLMLACGIAVAGARLMLGGSIYSLRLRDRGVPVGLPSRRILAGLQVGSVMSRPPPAVLESAKLDALVALQREATAEAVPVVSEAGRFVGLLSLDEVRADLLEPGLQSLVVARDLCREQPVGVHENDSLETALRRMVAARVAQVPVVAKDDPGRLVGMLTSMDVLAAYNLAIAGSVTPTKPPSPTVEGPKDEPG